MENQPQARVVAYIDGFNLYHGLRDSGYRRYYWLDLVKLAQNLLREDQRLVFTKYFTARISGPRPGDSPASARAMQARCRRQVLYLDALSTLPRFGMFEGHYLPKGMECRCCGARWTHHEEKMTDVNIATQLLVDAYGNAFDVALIVSADSDLVPPVHAVRRQFERKRVLAAFPPQRHSDQLRRAVSGCLTIGRSVLSRSQLPEEVVTSSGFVIRRPSQWR